MTELMWKIGGEGEALALEPDRHRDFLNEFADGVNFRIGQDDPARSWPRAHPGPADDWGGEKRHAFAVTFRADGPIGDDCLLSVRLRDASASGAAGMVEMNGFRTPILVGPGAGSWLAEPGSGQAQQFEIVCHGRLLRNGENTVAVSLLRGGWIVYDSLTFEAGVQARPIERVQAECTSLFKAVNGRMCQALLLEVEPTHILDGVIHVRIGGESLEFAASELDVFEGKYVLLVPECSEPRECEIEIVQEAESPISTSLTVEPRKKITFQVIHHTHFDLGFTDRQDRVWELHAANLDSVVDFCKQTADWPDGEKFKYVIEGSSLLQYYERNRPPERFSEICELIREGRVEVLALHSNLLTEFCGHEEFVRALSYAADIRQRLGLPVDTAMINDIPGYTWIIPELLTPAGIRFLNLRANHYRGRLLWHRPGALPRPFMWRGPAGSAILTWYTETYRDGNWLREAWNWRGMLDYTGLVEGISYPYDVFPLRMGGDNNVATINAAANIRRWKAEWDWPKLNLVTNREFGKALANHGPFPVYSGDMPDWWADGATSSAYETGLVRVAHHQLPVAEAISAAVNAATNGGVPYPAREIDEAYEQQLIYDEHTWGASHGGQEPYAEDTIEQWEMKAGFARDASRMAGDLLARSAAGLASVVSSSKAGRVVVWNPCSWDRTDVAYVEMPGHGETDFIDVATGERASGQRLTARKDTIAFIARNVPAMGYRVYEPVPAAPSNPCAVFDGKRIFKSPEYAAELDLDRGGIRQIFSERLRQHLVDSAAPFCFNEWIYEMEKGRAWAQRARIELLESGPVLATVRARMQGDNFPEIIHDYTLFAGLPRIEIRNTLEKLETLEIEDLYYAFPFDAPNPRFHVEITDGIMAPEFEQLPYTCRDFYSVQNWVRVASDRLCFLWATREAPLVQLSQINTGRWADHLDIHHGHVYAYLMTNRWRTNYKPTQHGRSSFGFAITSSDRLITNTAAVRFGWEFNTPLVTSVIPSEQTGPLPDRTWQFCSLDAPNVIVQCVKRARKGDGLIVRLREVEGLHTTAKLTFPELPLKSAVVTNIVEEDIGPAETDSGTVTAEIRGFGIATVRLYN